MKMTLTAGVAALLAMAAEPASADAASQGSGSAGLCECNCTGQIQTNQIQQAPALPPVSHTRTFQVVGQ